jgi:DNA-binding NtrC family response regulator
MSSTRVNEPPLQPDMRQVLVVEDERRLRDVLVANIREMGLDPIAVPNAEQALQLIEKSPIPIVLLDLNLPGMNGLDLCALVHRRWPTTQAIILTGYGDLNAAKKAIRLEVVDFLTKPCGMDDLEKALERARSRFREKWIASQPAAGREPKAEPSTRRAAVPRIPPSVLAAAQDNQVTHSLEDVERDLIFAALARHGGNREAAAADLGISVRKLYYRLQQYQHARSTAEEGSTPM